MHKQFVEGVQECKKVYLIMMEIKICHYCSMARTEDPISPVQRTGKRGLRMGF